MQLNSAKMKRNWSGYTKGSWEIWWGESNFGGSENFSSFSALGEAPEHKLSYKPPKIRLTSPNFPAPFMRVCGRKSFIRLITFENLKQVLVFHQILFTTNNDNINNDKLVKTRPSTLLDMPLSTWYNCPRHCVTNGRLITNLLFCREGLMAFQK